MELWKSLGYVTNLMKKKERKSNQLCFLLFYKFNSKKVAHSIYNNANDTRAHLA